MSGRKKLSGHQYRKNAKEKKEREKESNASLQKLDRFVVLDRIVADPTEMRVNEGKNEPRSENTDIDSDNIDLQIKVQSTPVTDLLGSIDNDRRAPVLAQ